jgi:hypothetical protein
MTSAGANYILDRGSSFRVRLRDEVLPFHDVLLLAGWCGNSLTGEDVEQESDSEQAYSHGLFHLVLF